MTPDHVLSELTPLLREVFDDHALAVTMTTSPDDIPEWDSFHQINIVIATEQRFGIKLSLTEIEQLRDVSGLVRLVVDKHAQR
jgi:acyl carrier protein